MSIQRPMRENLAAAWLLLLVAAVIAVVVLDAYALAVSFS